MEIFSCLFVQQPIGYIMNFNSFIAVFWMFRSGNNHFRISISDLKQRRTFSLKCFLPGNVVADLNINLFAASLWRSRKLYCPNCRHLVIGYEDKDGATRMTCDRY